MTQTGYLPPVPAPRPVWRAVVTVLASVVGPPAGAVAGFLSAITWSGCFLSCHEPDHVRGGLLGLLALALLLSGPVLAAALMRSARWVAAAIAAPVVLLLLTQAGRITG
jgi:hypothetical protein